MGEVDFDGPEFWRLPDAGSGLLLDRGASPLTALMARSPRMEFGRPVRVRWLEDERDAFPPVRLSLNAARDRRLRRWVESVQGWR